MLDVLGCPFDGCGGRLAAQPGGTVEDGALIDGVLGCVTCEAPYPVLGGVPIVTVLPTSWLASFRESVLASLAEVGRASPVAVSIIDAFVQPAAECEPMRFGDDWTSGAGIQPAGGTDQASDFAAFVHGASEWGPDAVLSVLLGAAPLGTLVEIGCGDGSLTARLRHGADRVVVGDLSLRAVLRAAALAAEESGPPVCGAVLDAEHLGLRSEAADTIVAAQVTDLLEDPAAFLAGAARALRSAGRIAMSSPEPDGLDELIEGAGLEIIREVDGVPWLHAHSERYFQVYLVKALLLQEVG